ncbi:MAG TPA: hypothetical protein VLH59_06535 [Ignavibacteriaceae bacterium]|nr:hypothetical protein [Ignavibacteriaceae bacterium]
MTKNFSAGVFLFIYLTLNITPVFAWVYPEHRDIMLFAITKLTDTHRTILDDLWTQARIGYEFRLTESPIDLQQLTKPKKIDYAAWPAIAGDHSCSAENMLYNILQTDWILKVADITAQLKIDIASAEDRAGRINALRTSDIKLQGADPGYATRAGSNNVHFLLSLQDVNMDAISYILSCTDEGVELNAIAAYAWYHYSALSKASLLGDNNLTQEERSIIILSALADEAFAIHFLQDVFASGHVAGTWGDASQRKGTHDYYNEMGLNTSTWEGENVVLTGDAWMRYEDADRAAKVVKISLEQLLDAALGKYPEIIYKRNDKIPGPENFNVCQNNYLPLRGSNPAFEKLLTDVFIKTPVPALIQGLGELPRFRAEIGTFVGFSPAIKGSLINGGFGLNQETNGFIGTLEVAARFGVGLDGVLNESGDGLIFLAAGWRQDGSSSTSFVGTTELQNYGNLLAAIPGRSAFNGRLRLPFYILPLDLLILAPVLFFIDQEALTKVGVTAVNGGLVPWQSGIETSVGRIQFVLGREVAVYFYGRTKERDALFNVSTDAQGQGQLNILSYRSTLFEFPIVEYRPFKTFDVGQRSSMFIQLYGGFDIPGNVEVLESTGDIESTPELKTVWNLGLRLIFDWRHYF